MWRNFVHCIFAVQFKVKLTLKNSTIASRNEECEWMNKDEKEKRQWMFANLGNKEFFLCEYSIFKCLRSFCSKHFLWENGSQNENENFQYFLTLVSIMFSRLNNNRNFVRTKVNISDKSWQLSNFNSLISPVDEIIFRWKYEKVHSEPCDVWNLKFEPNEPNDERSAK